MQTISVQPNNSPLAIAIDVQTPQQASFTVYVYNQDGKTVEFTASGTNKQDGVSQFQLPNPASAYMQCYIQFDATLIDAAVAGSPYQVDMVVLQDGTDVGSVTASGIVTQSIVNCSALAQLLPASSLQNSPQAVIPSAPAV